MITLALLFFLNYQTAKTELAQIHISENEKGEIIMTIYNKGKYTDEELEDFICESRITKF